MLKNREELILKRILLLIGLVLVMVATTAFAAEATSDPLLMNLARWYKANPMPTTPGISGETVYKSSRAAVIVRQAPQGTSVAPHYHTMVDETLYVVEGEADLLTNGNWVKLKPGDVHVNPRGAVHALKVTDSKGFRFVSVFAPPQPAQGDMVYIPAGESLQAPAGLMDASTGAGIVVSLKEWQSSPVGQEGQQFGSVDIPDYNHEYDGMRAMTIIETPRSSVMLRSAGYGASRRHTVEQEDEIIIVVSGTARSINGENSNILGRNDLQVIPKGNDNVLKLMLGDSLRFVTVFAMQEKPRGSR
jgi:quercetin dioxygenase-like cupin family protein